MQILNAKQKLEEIISLLPESKLDEVIDFACVLRDKEEADYWCSVREFEFLVVFFQRLVGLKKKFSDYEEESTRSRF